MRRVQTSVTVGPATALPPATAALPLLTVMQWRGHVLTYLAGGPVIAVLTGTVCHGAYQRVSA